MDFLRRAYTDTKLRFHVTKLLSAASAQSGQLSKECIDLAQEHPDHVIAVLCDKLNIMQPKEAYAYLLLLEKFVDSCSYSFHVAMAREYTLQEKLVNLAVMRVENSNQRQARRLARLTVLEYSRMFADDENLSSLSLLARAVEKQTGRNLVRCIQVEPRSVSFQEPRPEDIVLISPVDRSAYVSPIPQRRVSWSCHVCTFINRSTSSRCYACHTPKPTRSPSPPPPQLAHGAEVPRAAGILNGTVCARGGDSASAESEGALQKEASILAGVATPGANTNPSAAHVPAPLGETVHKPLSS